MQLQMVFEREGEAGRPSVRAPVRAAKPELQAAPVSHAGGPLSPEQARARLVAAFGAPTPRRRCDPLSQLVLGLLEGEDEGRQVEAEAALARLRARFRGGPRSEGVWSQLADARPYELEAVLGPAAACGAQATAERLVRVLKALRARAGEGGLNALARMDVEAALDWLGELPGVEPQVAAAVLGFSRLDRPVMVVTAEVARVAGRLGLAPTGQGGRAAGAAIVAAAPASWAGAEFTELHLLLRRLAQDVCRASRPACAACPVSDACPGVQASLTPDPAPRGGVDGWLRRRVARLERGGAAGAGGPTWGTSAPQVAFPGGGLAPGLHQVSPARAADFAAALLPAVVAAARAEAPDAPVRLLALAERDALREGGDLYAPGLEALGAPAACTAFLRLPSAAEALRAAEAALRLAAAPVVLVELRRGEALADLAATRRLDLLARRGGAWLFLVTPTLGSTSAAVTRWRVGSAPSAGPSAGPFAGLSRPGRRPRLGPPAVHLHLVRNRQGRTGAWSAQWSADERRFLHVAPLSASVDAPVVDRPRASGAVAVAAAA